jgi:hypothetical protein
MAATRPLRWRFIAALGLVSGGLAWGIGHGLSRRIERRDIALASRLQPPGPGASPPSRIQDINNSIMRRGLVRDLDGTAVAYTKEADGLVNQQDGSFRTDLSLERMAAILNVDRATIALPDNPHEINPDAVLFKAQVGTLTERIKELSRVKRKKQALQGRKGDWAYSEWNVRNLAFTLKRLKHPNDEEKIILAAIGRAARAIMPQPGDKILAVGVIMPERAFGVILTPGLLPLEALPDATLPGGSR